MDDDVPHKVAAGTGMSHEQLSTLQQRTHKRSEMAGRLVDMGEIGQGSPADIWVGKSTVAQRLKSGEITEADIHDSFALLAKAYIPRAPGAAVRCVEDRPVAGYDDSDPAWYGMALGPQFQGGTPDEAIARRLAHGYVSGSTLDGDITELCAGDNAMHAPGAHYGSHADSDRTDCGAVDNELVKTTLYEHVDAGPIIDAKVAALFQLGNRSLNPRTLDVLKLHARDLAAAGEQYFATSNETLSTVARLNPGGVTRVSGDHKPVFLIANYVEQDTLHTSHFAALTGYQIYSFGLDAGYILHHKSEQEAANIFAAAVATAMRITDGTVRLGARLPRDGMQAA